MRRCITFTFALTALAGAAMGAVTNEYRINGTIELAGFPPAVYSISFDAFPQAVDLEPGEDLGKYEATIDGAAPGIGAEISGPGFVQLNIPEQRIDLIFDGAIVSIPGVGEVPLTDDFFVELPVTSDDQPTEIITETFDPPLELDLDLAPGLSGVVKTEQFVFEPFCPGDINDTLNTDALDLNILLGDFGCTGGDCIGDVDGDGDTDSADLNALLSGFGEDCPSP